MAETKNTTKKSTTGLDPLLVKGSENLASRRAGQKVYTNRSTEIEGTGNSVYLRKGQKRTVSKFLADQLVEKGSAKIV